MKNILVLAIVGAIVLFSGCSDQGPTVATQDNAYEQTVATVDNNTKALERPDAMMITWTAPMFSSTYYKHGARWESVQNDGAVIVSERYQTFENVPISGGLVGKFVKIEHNSDIRKSTGNGRAWGTYEMQATLAGTPATGVFKGHYWGFVQNWRFSPVGPGLPTSGIFGAGERYIRGLNWYGVLNTDGPISNMKFTGLVNTPRGM